MTMDNLKELRAKARALSPVAHIGKEGLTPHALNHISEALRARKLIKIKILPSAAEGKDKKEYARNLAGALGARLIDSIGNMVVLQEVRGH